MKRILVPVVPGFVLAALAVAALVFMSRPPVLVVTDVPFAVLYGEDRIRRRQASASLSLFRPVRPVVIADDAGPDMLVAAVSSASERPFAVLFPRRFAVAAERFHGEFPEIPVVLFRGTAPASALPAGNGIFNVYGTDRATDLFRAGFFAGAIGSGQNRGDTDGGPARRTHVLWQDRLVGSGERELFSRAVMERDPGSAVVFVNAADNMPDTRWVSSLVLAGAGADYLERNPGIPVILFSWLDPALTSGEVVAMFDDSPWALAVTATRMASAGVASGAIPSKPLIFSDRIADNRITRMLRRDADRTP